MRGETKCDPPESWGVGWGGVGAGGWEGVEELGEAEAGGGGAQMEGMSRWSHCLPLTYSNKHWQTTYLCGPVCAVTGESNTGE